MRMAPMNSFVIRIFLIGVGCQLIQVPVRSAVFQPPILPVIDVTLVTNAAFNNVLVSTSFTVAGPILSESTQLFTKTTQVTGVTSNVPNTVVQRDSTGSISAGAVTAATVTANSITATSVKTNTLTAQKVSAPVVVAKTAVVTKTTATTTKAVSTVSQKNVTVTGTKSNVNAKNAQTPVKAGLAVSKVKKWPLTKQLVEGAGLLSIDATGTTWELQAPSGVAEIFLSPDTMTGSGLIKLDGSDGFLISQIAQSDIVIPPLISNEALAPLTTSGLVANSATSGTSANTPNTIVLRDGTGSFEATAVNTVRLQAGATGAQTVLTILNPLSLDASTGTPLSMVTERINYLVYGTTHTVLNVWSFSNLNNPTLLSDTTFGSLGVPRAARLGGRYLYVAATPGFSIIDTSNLASPVIINQADTTGYGEVVGLEVQAPYIYTITVDGFVRTWNSGGTIVPIVIGEQSLPGFVTPASSMVSSVVQGSTMYVWGQSSTGTRLWILDIVSPSNPVLVATLDVDAGATPRDCTIGGRYLYTLSSVGLQVIDCLDRTNPVEVTSLSASTYTRCVYGGTLLYVSDGTFVIDAFDISSPANPVFSQNISMSQDISHAALGVSGNTLLVTTALECGIVSLGGTTFGGCSGGDLVTGGLSVSVSMEGMQNIVAQGAVSVGQGISVNSGAETVCMGGMSLTVPPSSTYAALSINGQNSVAPLALFAQGGQSPLQLTNIQSGSGTVLVINGTMGPVQLQLSTKEGKQDIMPLDDAHRALLPLLRPVHYAVTLDKKAIERRGFGARATAAVARELVAGDVDNPLSIHLPSIVALLAHEVQEGRKTIERIKQRKKQEVFA